MKRRKMLIAITLVTIMLLNCFVPLMQVQAAAIEKTTMTFNTALYKGLKAYFQEIGVKAAYNDINHTIKMETSVIESIEELSLKEKGIEDITGLDCFSNVSRVILSANKLSEESNLAVLNNLPKLNYLDISSNNITDISEIQDLVLRLLAVDSNAVNLSSQVAKIVVDVPLDETEELLVYEAELPQILNIAGIAKNGVIENQGILKAEWMNESHENAYVDITTIPNPVTAENNMFEIVVGKEGSNGFTAAEGLAQLQISIKDVNVGAYNLNPASKNILKDSVFTLYYVVHTEKSEGIIFKDVNLYNAIKEQLTENQTVNKDLVSYPYTLTLDGEIAYDICTYQKMNETTCQCFNENGEVKYIICNIGTENEYITDINGQRINKYEFFNDEIVDSNGNVTFKRKVKIAKLNNDSEYLYDQAYDEALALVIDDKALINKITSLVLNDKEIKDLYGLEKFVGLESNLNLSYNYIDSLGSVYGLQINKDEVTAILQQEFRKKLEAMSKSKDKVTTAYETIETSIEAIEEALASIEEMETNLGAAESEEAKDQIKEAIASALAALIAEEGPVDLIEKALEDPQDGLNVNLAKMYTRLEAMYEVYNKEHRVISLLIPELNYLTEEEYEATQEKLKTLTGTKELVQAQVDKISTLEGAGALNNFEQRLIKELINSVGFDLADEENPISTALSDILATYEEEEAPRSTWKNLLVEFEKLGIFSDAVNYCLIQRMNTGKEGCLAGEFLLDKIKFYEEEGIEFLDENSINKFENIIAAVKDEEAWVGSMSNYGILHEWIVQYNADACEHEYAKVIELMFDSTLSSTELTERLENGIGCNDIAHFEQLMALANKFTAIDEIEKYLVLPDLKVLNVNNNKIETLGPVEVDIQTFVMGEEEAEDSEETEETTPDDTENEENTEDSEGTEDTEEVKTYGLDSLKNLKEFYAAHNSVTGDIICVDWSKLASLQRLDLAYNYISDISALEVLTRLRHLDVSDNMLEGAFNISVRNMKKLESLNLAGNRYTDITKLLLDYEMLAEGKFSEYFAREDTLDLDLSRQKIEIVIEEPISYDSSVATYEVELPPIFSQLEYIDVPRTAFGTTSTKGSIEVTGQYAYVPVNATGDYEASVKVIAANGYPEDVTTSIGINTECTIKYSVKEISINSVVINEEVSRVEKGTTQNFTATVEGTNVPDTTVTWVMEGAESENTTIDQNGLLTVAADETATEITIYAISNYDDTIETSKTIELFTKSVTEVIVNEQDVKAEKGSEVIFTAEVNGENLEDSDKTVAWTVENATSEATSIDENGVLVIAADETAEALTVVATSNYDNTKSGSSTVTIFVKLVTEVVVSEDVVTKPGEKVTFTAEVNGENLEDSDKGVTWAVSGNVSPYTLMNKSTGELTISENETAETLVVIATSKFDESKVDTAEVKLAIVKNVVVESESNRVLHGESIELTATVEGANLTDAEKEVTWEVSGANDEETVITEEGVLTIGANETAEAVIVKATSITNPSVYGTKEIEINIPVPELGYELDNDETAIIGVSPTTKVSEFTAKLLADEKYTVVVKRDGEVIADPENVATGDIAVIYLGDTLVEVYEIVVKGDVNADGKADALDSSLIKAHRAKLTTLTGVFYKAADIDESGDIAVRDVRLLLYHRARIDGYIL